MRKKQASLTVKVGLRCFSCYKKTSILFGSGISAQNVKQHINHEWCPHCGGSYAEEFDIKQLVRKIILFEKLRLNVL